jgi:group I intron endonuclease
MGAVFALFAAFYYWTPKIIGKTLNELLGNIHFWTLFVGVLQIIDRCKSFIFNLVKSIDIEDLTDPKLIETVNIDESTLEKELEEIPKHNLPNPKKGKTKIISEKLNNIPAEYKFIDLKISRIDILSNIKNKSGVYMFFNLFNGNSYIGSSIHLSKRFRVHISNVNKGKLPLYKSLRKYGFNNFVFLVLQFCEPVQEVCIGLEQYFLDLYKPKYNILLLAGSSEGFKHSPETIAKLKKLHSSKLHPRFGKKVSEEQKILTSMALKEFFSKNTNKLKGRKGILSLQYGIGGNQIIMKDENNNILSFPSINSARLHFRVRFNTISKNIDTNLPVLIKGKRWKISSKKT